MQYTSKLFGLAGGLAIAGLTVLACGKTEDSGSSGTLAVTGTVSSSVAVDDARAIAIDGDGHTISAYLDANRAFTLRLPVGKSYRVVIANPRREGGFVQVAHLTLRGDGAERDEWLGANEEGSVDLGSLVPASSAAQGAGSDLGIRTYGVPPSGGDTDGDDDDHEHHHDGDADGDDDGDDGDANLCTDGHDTEVKPTKDPGDKCKAKDHGKGKHEGRGRGHHHHPKSCSCPGDGGSSDGGGSSTDGGGSDAAVGGDAGLGAECLATSDCQLGLVCSGGICRAPAGGVGSECVVTADCLPGLMCVGGLCSLP